MNLTSPSWEKRRVIHLELTATEAEKVCIAGTFNDWHPEVSQMISVGNSRWRKDLSLPPGEYEYRFVVNGSWISDPHCLHHKPNGFGETNSVLIVQTGEEPPP